MKQLIIGTIAAVISHSFTVAGPPGNPSDWVPLPEFTDEFNGPALNATRWHAHNPKWKGRKPSLFLAKNVEQKDGSVHITMRKENPVAPPEGYHSFTTGAIKTKTKVLYGYFEARCKAMKSKGSSAFWFYDTEPEIWTEIDVFEIAGGKKGEEHVVNTDLHVFYTPTEKKHFHKPKAIKKNFNTTADYHVYAVDWSREFIKYYVDGELVRTEKNTHWHQPLYMNFDAETQPKWHGLPKAENLPSTFSIDYVRAWKRKS